MGDAKQRSTTECELISNRISITKAAKLAAFVYFFTRFEINGSTLKLVEYLKVFYICWMKTGYELLLPQGLTDYFDVIEVEEYATRVILHLDEKVLSESEMGDSAYLSKGFYPAIDIHDFPVRDRSLTLRVRRRRWQEKATGNPYMRDWEVIAQGTRLTREFAAFLKELS